MTYLDYQSDGAVDPRAIRLDRIFFRVALACGILPMAAGLIIVTLYYFFEWEGILAVGMLAIPIGSGVVLTGLLLAITWYVRHRSVTEYLDIPTRRRTGFFLLFLLLANFPVGAFCVFAGNALGIKPPPVLIYISNETGSAITDVTVHATEPHETHLGTIDPGKTTGAHFNPRHCKSIRIHVEQDGNSRELTHRPPPADDYLHVIVRPGLELEAEFVTYRFR